MSATKISVFKNTIERIHKLVDSPNGQELLDKEMVLSIKRNANNINSVIDQTYQEGRKLTIGIMGAMKAGKSSFLNALLFNGENILPKAATPMTASLSVLSYGEKSGASITFFSKGDWSLIETACENLEEEVQRRYEESQKEDHTHINNLPMFRKPTATLTPEQIRQDILNSNEQIRSFYETRELVRKNGLNINDYLGKTKEISSDNADWQQFIRSLNDYVGASGKYTPLVNYITLKLNNRLLKDIEIVDTPGLNDPFTSRSNRTQEYLGKCDVVLYLCQVSQFIAQQDVDFICKDMKNAATADAYIIGSQIDSGVLQYNRDEHRFQEAYNKSTVTYDKQAKKTLNPYSSNPVVAKLLQKNPIAIYVSSLMYSVALKKSQKQPLNQEEEHILSRLRQQFTDFDEVMSSPKDYFTLSGIDTVKSDILDKVKNNKQHLIDQKNDRFISSSSVNLLNIVNRLSQDLNIKLQDVTDDSKNPVKQLQQQKANLDKASSDISRTLKRQIVALQKNTEDIKSLVNDELYNHQTFEVRSESSTSSSSSGFLFWKTTTTTTTTHSYASASEVMDNIRQYAIKAQALINNNNDVSDIKEQLQAELSKNIKGVFDLSDSNFNPKIIIDMIESRLSDFEVRRVTTDFLSDIESSFNNEYPSNVVADENIHQLKKSQSYYQQKVQSKLWQEIDQNFDEMQSFLNKQSADLCRHLKDKIDQRCMQIEKMQQNRELYINKINTLSEQLKQLITELSRY